MSTQIQPLLSITMIFKNEIRCLERCLKSLTPLREAIPCELIMADTGSDDGSREVAERYADLVFDFPWINDFSAARNAVLDRCAGKWAMVLDADEWLKGDLSNLIHFVRDVEQYNFGALMTRNYKTMDLGENGRFTDFSSVRLVRMSTGVRYINAIHERWDAEIPSIYIVGKIMIHHDGYAKGGGWTPEKRNRNMVALREKLAKNPDDLLTLEQCIESGEGTPEFLDYLRRAQAGVRAKALGWERVGASILRYGVVLAANAKMPELEEWIQEAHTMFPNSIFTRIDVVWVEFSHAWETSRYEECVSLAESYFKALEDYDTDQYDLLETMFNTLSFASPEHRRSMHVFLADSYRRVGRTGHCLGELEKLDGTLLNGTQVDYLVRTLIQLHNKSDRDITSLIRRIWKELGEPTPTEQHAQARKDQFVRSAAAVFSPDYQKNEKKNEKFHRHAYTAFLPLAGVCPLGDAAVLIGLEEPQAVAERLGQVEELEQLPIAALAHALEKGIPFPDRNLNVDTMDTLAARLAGCEGFDAIVLQGVNSMTEDLNKLIWARGLVLAGVRVCPWKEESQGLVLAKSFAQVENVFLPQYYAPAFLREENVELLPPMHRFGWYCAQAFAQLEQGNAANYVRLLHQGLTSCPGMKNMVEFLSSHTPELRSPSEELRSLAEQVRSLLAGYSPDDPAVAMLKASAAYQKVAWLIEEENTLSGEGAAKCDS